MQEVVRWLCNVHVPHDDTLTPLELDLDSAFSNVPKQGVMLALRDIHKHFFNSQPYFYECGGLLFSSKDQPTGKNSVFAWSALFEAVWFELHENVNIKAARLCWVQKTGIPRLLGCKFFATIVLLLL